MGKLFICFFRSYYLSYQNYKMGGMIQFIFLLEIT